MSCLSQTQTTVGLRSSNAVTFLEAPPSGTTDVVVLSINSGGVVNAASYAPGAPVAAGSITAIFGTFPVNSLSSAQSLPLPANISGLSFQVGGGMLAPLFFVSNGQAAIQVPWELGGQSQASISVTVNSQVSAPQTFNLVPFAPGIFSINAQGTGNALN